MRAAGSPELVVSCFLTRCMLGFDPVTWDMFEVYNTDFVAEIMQVSTFGLLDTTLFLQPFGEAGGSDCNAEGWSDFRWRPDGAYSNFVTCAAIVFIVMVGVACTPTDGSADVPSLPPWLVIDLSGVPARRLNRGSAKERGVSCIRETLQAHGRHRKLDPFMLDQTFSAMGLNDGSAGLMVSKMNAQFFYDSKLHLGEFAGRRQANLLNPQKFTQTCKDHFRNEIDARGSLEATGFSLRHLDVPEFWIHCSALATSHSQWASLATTTESSCLGVAKVQFEKARGGGHPWSSQAFRFAARRFAVVHQMIDGIFKRRLVAQTVVDHFYELFKSGAYDEDLNSLLANADDDVPDAVLEFDEHLIDSSNFVQDVLKMKDGENAATSCQESVPDRPISWPPKSDQDVEGAPNTFEDKLEEDVEKFRSMLATIEEERQELGQQEEKYDKLLGQVCGCVGFCNKFAPMLPFKADEKSALKMLTVELEKRVEQVVGRYGLVDMS